MKKYIVFTLLAAFCLTGNAAKKKNSKKKVEAEKVDTVDVRTFSYLIGRLNTQGLKPYLVQQKGIDTTYMAQFIQGFQAEELTVADKEAKARIAGVEIRQDVKGRVMSAVSRQMNDSVDILDHNMFLQGFQDGLLETASEISTDSAIQIVNKQLEYYHKTNMEHKYGANRKAGIDFLKANAKKDSVQTTPSGLQYKILVAGTGDKPTAEQKVVVNYEGRLIDGKVFDSSYKRGQPATFGVNQVIKGWTEALTMMPAGSKWELYIPQELAYGDREQSSIPPFSTLIFTVELLEVQK